MRLTNRIWLITGVDLEWWDRGLAVIDNNVVPTNYKAVMLHNFGKSLQCSRAPSFYIAKPHTHISPGLVDSFANRFSPVTDVDLHRTQVMSHRRDEKFINPTTDGIVEQLWRFLLSLKTRLTVYQPQNQASIAASGRTSRLLLWLLHINTSSTQ